MRLLALDTSTTACSVAMWHDGQLFELFETAANRHSSLILGMVDQVLAESGATLRQCDAIAFGCGPGSFTGLRIGVGVVQGLAFGSGIPVVPVSSLAAQAARSGAENVLAAFDARMGQLYWGLYRAAEGRYVAAGDGNVMVTAPKQVGIPAGEHWTAIGTGCDLYEEGIRTANPDSVITFVRGGFPHAMDVAALGAVEYRMGKAIPAAAAAPEYVRNQVTA